MRLNREQKRILEGKEGKILQQAMIGLVDYGTALGAEEFVPVSSAHTFFQSPKGAAQYFPPRRVQLSEKQIGEFCEELSRIRVKARTTIDPGFLDLEKWGQMGGTEISYNSARKVVDICRKTGIMANWTCIPYLVDNIPIKGEHCSWSESSALIYINSMLGARTNRDAGEASFFSALLGITPNCGMHLDENRKGTHLIDVQCALSSTSDWGSLGYFAGKAVGDGIPVFTNLKMPTVEEAKQLGAAINVPGGSAMFHIVGVTPEAPTLETAFGGNEPVGAYVFDESAKKKVHKDINHQPRGNVNMVFFGCPHLTLHEIKEIATMIEGEKVAKETRLWVMTTHSIRASAERLGYAQVIEESGGELLADGCLLTYYVYSDSKKPSLERIATDSVKQGLGARRSFGSKVFFGDTKQCVDIAINGRV